MLFSIILGTMSSAGNQVTPNVLQMDLQIAVWWHSMLTSVTLPWSKHALLWMNFTYMMVAIY